MSSSLSVRPYCRVLQLYCTVAVLLQVSYLLYYCSSISTVLGQYIVYCTVLTYSSTVHYEYSMIATIVKVENVFYEKYTCTVGTVLYCTIV